MARDADTLIFAGFIIPVKPAQQLLTNHAVAFKNGRISALLPAPEARQLEAGERIELPQHVLLPGLINLHGHAAMSLLRGYADDCALQTWLQQHIWPAEAAHVSAQFVCDGADLAIAEMLRSGTTCFSDMYYFPDVTAQRAAAAGMRCQIAFPVFDYASAWGSDADEYISKGLALHDSLKHSELIRVVFGPHAPYSVNETTLQKIATLADELELPVQIHLHETAAEVSAAEQASGQRPLTRLKQLGLIGPRSQCVHMTALNDADIALLAGSGAHVVHCPRANLKLAAGLCPLPALQAAGVNVALGTDGAAGNNNLNLLDELRSAALLASLGRADGTPLPAHSAVNLATLAGARALGMEAELGSIEPGKLADLIAIDLARPETRPLYQPISQVVFAAQAEQVTHSWIGGQAVMRERQLLRLPLDDVLARAAHWQQRIGAAD